MFPYGISMARNVTINISMPDRLSRVVRQRMAAGGFGNTSEYFRHLVREDERRAAEDRLEELLLAGLRGKRTKVDEAWWTEQRAKLAARHKVRKTA